MAESERTRARKRRAGARGHRRSVAEPFEKLDQAADEATGGARSEARGAARKAVGTAAAAALAGALAGGAKALADRRQRQPEHEEPPPSPPEAEAPPSPSDDAEEEEDDGDPVAEERPREPARGASSSDVAKMIGRARTHLRDLLDEEPESVSGIERSNGNWSFILEVVEVHRVPDTTDVLASYDVVLDNDGDLVRLERKRRYFRSQVEEG